jgi:hypothetical protein
MPWRDRLPYLGAALLAAVLLSQALQLEWESAFGPGPGVFAQITTALALFLALALLLVPALSRDIGVEEAEPPLEPAERRSFLLYMAALPLMVVGSAWLGFLLTCVLVALLLCWGAERRRLVFALAFGLGCGALGTIGLGHFLHIEMPYGVADSLLLSLVR